MIRIYNSLTKQKEEFKPLDPQGKEVKMYVCGPTVYDEPHIGHLRSAYVFDVMRRYLEYSGYKVKFVRNVTDVDDKIIDKAREAKPADLLAEVRNVSEKYLNLYKDDLKILGIQEPTIEPKATTHIQDMQWLISKLIEGGKAYASEGDVYFDVNHFKDYGKLSHQNKEAMQQNLRIDKNEKKRDALDFALWKKAKEGEPSWDSPWGKGRPGWHIECSAMSMKYLGESFDIHGGGRDLIFPHHENEIAQSESVTGSQFANYWIHHGLITVNEQKMSKSLKNFITLKQMISSSPSRIEELKFLFLGTHYSAPLDYSERRMMMEKTVRNNFINFLIDAKKYENIKTDNGLKEFEDLFNDAMNDDFNTPQAITIIHKLISFAKDNNVIGAAAEKLKKFFKVLGISYLAIDSDLRFNSAPKQLLDRVDYLMKERDQARQEKNYPKSDKFRQEIIELLKEYNGTLVDMPDGTMKVRFTA